MRFNTLWVGISIAKSLLGKNQSLSPQKKFPIQITPTPYNSKPNKLFDTSTLFLTPNIKLCVWPSHSCFKIQTKQHFNQSMSFILTSARCPSRFRIDQLPYTITNYQKPSKLLQMQISLPDTLHERINVGLYDVLIRIALHFHIDAKPYCVIYFSLASRISLKHFTHHVWL